jgi:antibiotic biosynthesis monooxygenase (ABM) superfamily enzyme
MSIHVAITRRILPGKEAEFFEAARRFMGESFAHNAVSGASIVSFPSNGSNEVGLLRSFPSEAEKEAFYNSDMYRQWEDYAATITEGPAQYRQLTGLEAWFRTPGINPPRWKMALLTLCAVWPANMVLANSLGVLIAPWPQPLRILISSATLIALLTWLVMPHLTKLAEPWLDDRKGDRKTA